MSSTSSTSATSSTSRRLECASYDSLTDKWTPVPGIPGAESGFAPAVEAYKSRLYCLHQDLADDGAGTLWWSSSGEEPIAWSENEAVLDADGRLVPCAGPPAVTHANDFLYCVNHRSGKDNYLWWSRYNMEGEEIGWRNWQPVEDKEHTIVRSANPAALAVYDGLVYCVHDDEDGRLRWITYDTHARAWGEDSPIPGDIPSRRVLAVERYKDLLYCVHDGEDDGLYWLTYDSGTGEWSEDRPVRYFNREPVRGARTLRLSRHNDFLYFSYYRGPDDGTGKLHWLRFNSDYTNPWSSERAGPSGHAYPGLDTAPYFGLLYQVYRA
ncbi:hypothetical protein GCM10009639_25760 [Kitasatospora putterlickiae]|uniref:Uncharacterized protein n=1 Tax=Kitasatospora putterlickiae TaxID=221725 RepID=A0ABP4IQJ3_9ACTN